MERKNHVFCKPGRCRREPAKIIANLLKRIYTGNKSYIIAVAGPGGTGKSVFSRKLRERLAPNSSLLALDDYKVSRKIREERAVFGPHPQANRLELIKEHLSKLKTGKSIRKPVYDSRFGEAREFTEIQAEKFIILDGEIAAYSDFRPWLDFTIFIDSHWKTQLKTRVVRDIEKRNYTKEKAIATFLQSNLKEFGRYGVHSKKNAQIHLFCHDDYRLTIESVDSDLFEDFEEVSGHSFKEVELTGPATRLIYPVSENRSLNFQSLLKLIDWTEKRDFHRIIISKCHDWGSVLSQNELTKCVELALEFFPGLVFYEMEASSWENMVKWIKYYENLGVDGIIINWSKFKEISLSMDKEFENLMGELKGDHGIPILSANDDHNVFHIEENIVNRMIIEELIPVGKDENVTGSYSFRLRKKLELQVIGFSDCFLPPLSKTGDENFH